MAKKNSKPKRNAKKPPKATHAGNVILHLSDLHFGYNLDEQAKAERKNALDNLISIISKQDPDWKPTIICITGDIAMKASSQDYSEAKTWLVGYFFCNFNPAAWIFIICGFTPAERHRVA